VWVIETQISLDILKIVVAILLGIALQNTKCDSPHPRSSGVSVGDVMPEKQTAFTIHLCNSLYT
jgi:hypothetical protein